MAKIEQTINEVEDELYRREPERANIGKKRFFSSQIQYPYSSGVAYPVCLSRIPDHGFRILIFFSDPDQNNTIFAAIDFAKLYGTDNSQIRYVCRRIQYPYSSGVADPGCLSRIPYFGFPPES
jgi:hypothetical protein